MDHAKSTPLTTHLCGEGNSFELKLIWPQIRKANENMTGLVSPTSLATEKAPRYTIN